MARKATPTQKGGNPPMRKMVVTVPEDLFKTLKIHAVQTDRTIRELVIEGIEHILQKGGEKKK
jgi:hypothetical protein